MVERASWGPRVPILEIGPGGGALTSALLEAGHSVRAIEKDPRLVEVLQHRFSECEDRFEVVLGDALKTEWLPGESALPGTKPWMAGNLPYSITTPLLIRALALHRHLAGVVMMVQREYGERLLSAAGNKTYGSITAWTRVHGDARSLLKVGRSSFWPRPGVESVVLELAFPDPPRFEGNRGLVERVIRAGFSQRRKKLRNTLASGLHLEKEQVETVLRSVQLDPEARAETLEWSDFVAFAQALETTLEE